MSVIVFYRIKVCLSIILLSAGTWFSALFSQGVTIGTNAPAHPSAVLDLQSINQGFALPRLTTAQRNTISSPVFGLQVYNTDTDCIETYFATGGWRPTQCGCTVFPNAQFSVGSANLNTPVTLTAPSPGATNVWTFQQGTPSTATGTQPQVSWSQSGTYGITLTSTDSAGCSSTHTDSINVVSCVPFNHTFSTCGQTGRTGPSQAQCNTAYGAGFVTVTGGIQFWTVPHSGVYTIEVAGSGVSGGRGAKLSGEFALTAGDVLKLVVGQAQGSGGGSGGTFVATQQNTPLIIGGGGGAPLNSTASANHDASHTQVANNGNRGYGAGGNAHLPVGQGGEWRAPQFSGIYGGAGGGGFNSNGTGSNYGCGGQAFVNGAEGGLSACGNGDSFGGFGGGGGGYTNIEPGGGGGYSGGGGGGCGSSTCGGGFSTNRYSGGGGSFNSGSNPVNLGLHTGQGYITISVSCP